MPIKKCHLKKALSFRTHSHHLTHHILVNYLWLLTPSHALVISERLKTLLFIDILLLSHKTHTRSIVKVGADTGMWCVLLMKQKWCLLISWWVHRIVTGLEENYYIHYENTFKKIYGRGTLWKIVTENLF